MMLTIDANTFKDEADSTATGHHHPPSFLSEEVTVSGTTQ
jgi:hypothetical protein